MRRVMLWWSMACLALSGTASGSATEFGGMILGREEEFVPLLQSLRGREGIRWIRGQSPRAGELGYQSLGDVRPLVLSATDGPLDGLPGDLLTVRNVVRDGVAARPDTRTWEVWNEPDFHFVRDSAADMAAVLKAAWWGIKAARPDDHVIMPSLAFRPSRYAMELMHNGAASWTDGYNVHFYGWPSDYARVLAQHRVLASAAGLEVPFWVTEIGYYQLPAAAATEPEALAAQTAFHERVMVESVLESVAVHLAFALSPAREGAWDLGLSDAKGTWRPALASMTRLAARLRKAEPIARLVHRDTAECLGAALREHDEEEARWLIFWSATRPREGALPGVQLSPVFPERFSLRLNWPPRLAAVRAGQDGEVTLTPDQVAHLELSAAQVHHLRFSGHRLPRVGGCDWEEIRPAGTSVARPGVRVGATWRRELDSLPPRREPSPVVIQWRAGVGWVADKPSQTLRIQSGGMGDLRLRAVNLGGESTGGEWRVAVPPAWSVERAEASASGASTQIPPGNELTGDWLLAESAAAEVNLRVRPPTAHDVSKDPARLSAHWRDAQGREDVASVRLSVESPEGWSRQPVSWRDWLPRPGHPEAWQVFEPEPGRCHLEIAEALGAHGDAVVRWAIPGGLRATDGFECELRAVTARARVYAQVSLVTRDGEVWRHGELREVPTTAAWRIRAPIGEFAPTIWSRHREFGSPNDSRVRWMLIRFQGVQAGDILELNNAAWVRRR